MTRGVERAARYLIRRNHDKRIVGHTSDLGIALCAGYSLVDTVGEDGLGARKIIVNPHARDGAEKEDNHGR